MLTEMLERQNTTVKLMSCRRAWAPRRL